jgi:PGF-pre-PGF domain-containing protein
MAWPVSASDMMFRYDATHSGNYTLVAGITGTSVSQLWNFTTENYVESSPAVANGIVYVGSDDGNVSALNASTGAQIWNFTTGGEVYSSPAVVNGTVYVGSFDDKVYALNASTGAQIWNFTTGGPVYSSPVVTNSIVYVGGTDAYVYALNASTGAQIWNFMADYSVKSSPAVANGIVYIGGDSHEVYALNASTGAQIWSFTTGAVVESSPAVANGIVYVGSWDNKVYALNASTGAQIWNFTGMAWYSSQAVANGIVYVGSQDSNVYALNASTGAQIWNFTTGSSLESSPAVANGIVYIGSEDKKVYALNASTGAQIWNFTTGNAIYSSPAVANGIVYVGSLDNKVYALNTNLPTVTGVSLNNGPTTGGTAVTITGTNLGSATAVDFGPGNAGIITADTVNSITVTSPGGSTGTVDITVTTPGGTSATSAADHFTYTTMPVVTGVSPNTGPTGGGTSVTITGVNLDYATTIDFGPGNAATIINSDTATSITLESPPGSAGTVDVIVTTIAGTSATSPSDEFTYTGGGGSGIMFHYDATHSGNFTPVAGITGTSVSQLWNFTTGSFVLSSPAVINGTVYVGSEDDNVYALNADTGAPLWTFTTGGWVLSSPAVINGTVYVGSEDDKVYALNTNSGAQLWTFTTGGKVDSSPTVANGTVYVGSEDDKVYALNANSGALVWSYTTGGGVEPSPAVANGTVYVGSDDHNVYALNANSGALVWSYTTGIYVESDPTVANGTVYVGSDDRKVYALNAITGAQLWTFTTLGDVVSSPAVVNGTVYVGSVDGKVYALNAITGAQLWTFTTGSFVYSSPAVANGIVYVGVDDKNVYALNAITGAQIWNFATGDIVRSSPAVVNGTVYVGSSDFKVYALSTNPPPTVTGVSPNTGSTTGGTTVTITGTNLGGATAVDFGPGNASTIITSTTNSITVTSPSGSAGTVNITVTTSGGTSATSPADQFTYSAIAPQLPVASFTANVTSGTAPLPVQFTDTSNVVGGTMWNWSFGDNTWNNGTVSSSPEHTYSLAGSYPVSLIVTNTTGSNTSAQSTTITVTSGGSGLPTAAFTGSPTTGTAPLDVTFTDHSSVLSGTRWNWSFGDGTWFNATASSNPLHLYSSAGSYTISLTVTNSSGSNTMTRAGYISVNSPPSPSSGGSSGSESSDTGNGPSTFGATVPGVAAGTPASFSFTPVITDTAPTGITGVSLVTTQTLGQTDVVVSSVPPGSVTGPAGQPVAGVDNVQVVGTNPAVINKATVTFSVAGSWLTNNGISPGDVVAAYDNNGVWTDLPTTYTGQSGSTYTFTMTTQALGYFAITVFKTGTVPGINPGASAVVATSQSYPLGFEGLSYNADGQGTLSLDLAAAKTAGATVTSYFNRVEVYQHHSPGVTFTFWGDHFTVSTVSITGPVTRAEFVTDPLNATIGMGIVSGSVRADLPSLAPQRGWVNNTISDTVLPDTLATFKAITDANGLSLQNVAYTLQVKKAGVETGPSNVTLTVPASWVNLHGGSAAVHITRISDTGQTELLNTTYIGTDSTGNLIFRGDSPNGTSLFGLITAEAYAAEETEHPNVTYVGVSRSSMVTNEGMYNWYLGIILANPVLLVPIAAVLAMLAYFGWWKRRL